MCIDGSLKRALVGHWTFDQVSGGTVFNQVGGVLTELSSVLSDSFLA